MSDQRSGGGGSLAELDSQLTKLRSKQRQLKQDLQNCEHDQHELVANDRWTSIFLKSRVDETQKRLQDCESDIKFLNLRLRLVKQEEQLNRLDTIWHRHISNFPSKKTPAKLTAEPEIHKVKLCGTTVYQVDKEATANITVAENKLQT